MGAEPESRNGNSVWGWVGKGLLLAAAILGGGIIQVIAAFKDFKCPWNYIALGIVILVLIIVAIVMFRSLRNENRAIDKRDELVEAWDVATKAFDQPKETPEWQYKSVALRYEITDKWDLQYTDRSELKIEKGNLKFFTFTFTADAKAEPIESLKKTKEFSMRLDCGSDKGAELETRVNDVTATEKNIFVIFPGEGLETGYPCAVEMGLFWPKFWNRLKVERSDEVIFTATAKVDLLEQIVVFPKCYTEALVGFADVPKKGLAEKRKNAEGQVELCWTVEGKDIDLGKEYVLRFTIYDS